MHVSEFKENEKSRPARTLCLQGIFAALEFADVNCSRGPAVRAINQCGVVSFYIDFVCFHGRHLLTSLSQQIVQIAY